MTVTILADSLLATLLAAGGLGAVIRAASQSGRKAPLLLGVASVFCLWALLVDVRFGAPAGGVTLVTPGSQLEAGSGRVRWPGAAPGGIVSLVELAPDIRSVEVTGYGLPGAVWEEGVVRPRSFTPPQTPDGFMDLAWPERLQPGEEIHVRGRDSRGAGVVELLAAGEVVAIADVETDGYFELIWEPPVAGRIGLELRRDGASESSVRQPLGVLVEAPDNIQLGIELQAPSFDMRALRDWLVEGGGSGRLDITLAPGVERREQFGTPVERPDDLRIMDAASLRGLPAEALERLRENVAAGQGLLILPRQQPVPGWVGIATSPSDAGSELEVDVESQRLPVSVTDSIDITRGGLELLLASTDGTALGAARRHGAGVIAVLVLDGTASWITAGDARAHGRLWSGLLRDVAGFRSEPVWIQPSELVSTVGMRSVVCTSRIARPEIAPAPSLPLLEASRSTDSRCDAWWPDQTGWHRIDERWHYVYGADDFWPDRARTRVDATRAASRAQVTSQDPVGSPPDRRTFWWLMTLLVALGLWAENRLRSTSPAGLA